MAEHRDDLLALAQDRIRRQRPACPDVDAAREANLPAFLDAVIAAMPNYQPESSDLEPVGANAAPTPADPIEFDIDELVHDASDSSPTSSAMPCTRRRSPSRPSASGSIPVHGLTGDVVERSHLRLRAMVESLLTQVRLGAGLRGRQERLVVAQLVHESITFISADANEKRQL